MRLGVVVSFVVASLVLLGGLAVGQSLEPVPVSPGDGGEAAIIDQACPTFSWGGVPGAEAYELAVFEVSEETAPGQVVPDGADEPVLFVRLPGSATSWTPARSQCFAYETRYAWALRAVGEGYEGEWSRVQVFRVDPAGGLSGLEGVLKKVVEKMVADGKVGPREAGLLRELVQSRPQEAATPQGSTSASEPRKALKADEQRLAVEKEMAVQEIGVEEMPQEVLLWKAAFEEAPPTEAPGPGSSLGEDLRLIDGSDVEKIFLDSTDSFGTGADVLLRRNDGETTVQMDSQDEVVGGSFLQLSASRIGGGGAVTQTMLLSSAAGSNLSSRLLMTGQDAAGTSLNTTVDLTAAEGTTGAQLGLNRLDGLNTIELDAEEGTGATATLNLFAVDNSSTRRLTAKIRATEGVGPTADGSQISLFKIDGTESITLDAEFGGPGSDARIFTQELQITGGSDLCENFNVRGRGGDAQPTPGMVVSIVKDGSGELEVSQRAYDRSVAGVLSGAGGLKPGLYMGQRATVADGQHPVALSGRVYVLADASYGPIRPGDLLTTSNVPGHAMKVTDYERAQGAILGKAMSGLEQGRGLVLVLVSLQ